jgi:surface polysaccharide O-acyltransferase-like enzyme
MIGLLILAAPIIFLIIGMVHQSDNPQKAKKFYKIALYYFLIEVILIVVSIIIFLGACFSMIN